MLFYMIKKVLWQYRIFAYEVLDRHYQKKAINMSLKKEKTKKKYERFKKKNKNEYRRLMKYINT